MFCVFGCPNVTEPHNPYAVFSCEYVNLVFEISSLHLISSCILWFHISVFCIMLFDKRRLMSVQYPELTYCKTIRYKNTFQSLFVFINQKKKTKTKNKAESGRRHNWFSVFFGDVYCYLVLVINA